MPLDLAHVHLMLNHLPVVGAPLLLLLLTIGLLRGSRELIAVSMGLVVGLAAVTGLVYLTGEPAEHLVEHAPWFRDTLAETHEELTDGAASHRWKIPEQVKIFELVPPESVIDSDQHER